MLQPATGVRKMPVVEGRHIAAAQEADPVRAASGRVVAMPDSSLSGTTGVGGLHQFGAIEGDAACNRTFIGEYRLRL